MSFKVSTVAVFLLLGGCTANHKSIFRSTSIDEKDNITTFDAKQRSIISSKMEYDADGEIKSQEIRRYCSEPSPDVFSVLANSLGVGLDLSKSGDPTEIKTALQLAFSSAEQASTINRTQTINMLRELMYRTCERHLNGAYSDLEMSIQAIRDQRLMVSILGIEQLTNAARPQTVVIGASGGAGNGGAAEAIVRLDDANKSEEKALKEKNAAEKELIELNEEKKCEEIFQAVKDKKDLTDTQKANQPACNAANTKKIATTEAYNMAKSNHDYLKKVANSLGLSANTQLLAVQSQQSSSNQISAEVAKAVTTIIDKNFDNDSETMMFCYKALNSRFSGIDKKSSNSLANTCAKFIEKQIELQTEISSDEVNRIKAQIEGLKVKQFESIWPELEKQVSDKDKAESSIEKILEGISMVDRERSKKCFSNSNTQEDYLECFKVLSSNNRKILIENLNN